MDSLEEQKLTRLKYQFDMLFSTLRLKAEAIPVLSTLSVAMLIVATLNPELIPLPILWIKGIVSVLLISIPTSLFISVFQQDNAIKASFKTIKSIIDKDLERIINQTITERIMGLLCFSRILNN
ncbi:unnamed protein product [marine sediment metagenome]|uniref:Uncharacterized protein n=1 Tax=marine sediment metagenome TaxID=412755 RepID=X1C9N8_9ZZZZ